MIHRDPEPNRQWWTTPALALAVVVIFGIAGAKDYEDELREAEHYCDMVESGAWPNFKEIDCE